MSVFIKEATDYFEGLSAQHRDILHSRMSHAFCRYNDNEQFNQLRNNAGKNIVIIKSFFGRAVGDFDEATVAPHLVICFSCYAKNISSPEIVAASEKAFQILLDYWVKLRHDFEEDDCAWLKHIDWNNIQFDEIEQPWLQNHYGWDLAIPYKTMLPAYDETKWRAA